MTSRMVSRPTVKIVDASELPQEFEHARREPGAQTNFGLPTEPWWLGRVGITCVAAVTEANQQMAVEAVARGVDVVVALPDEPWAWPVARNLDRLGELVVGTAARPAASSCLSDDQLRLLRMLAAGRSIPEAAADLFMSVRTAERRVGAARRSLGVNTTAEALLLIEATT